MNKTKIIKAIKNADISDSDWTEDILDMIDDAYTRGYLDAKLEEMLDSMSASEEYFREDFLDLMKEIL